MSIDQIAEDLRVLASNASSDEAAGRLTFLRALGVPEFDQRLHPPDLSPEQLQASDLTPEQWEREKAETRTSLARAVDGYLQIWCEDIGSHGVAPAIDMLSASDVEPRLRIGLIRCLSLMVVNPFVYTYSRQPSPDETPGVVAVWTRLWQQEQHRFPPLDPARRQTLAAKVRSIAAETSRKKMFDELELLDATDAPYFAELLLGEAPLAEKVPAAEFLRLYISTRINLEVPNGAPDKEAQQVADNWIAHYQSHRNQYEFTSAAKAWYVIADTQYAHMVWRLVTFDFGRSTLRTREPVSELIWNAVLVSAPLMLMAETAIYAVAIPLGVWCAVKRGRTVDRSVSLTLFFLYSIPPFVAGMLFLLLFCYGDYVKWFPMERLHSSDADSLGFGGYLLDYLWHAALPVTCLSLFSLANMAMYSRSSMLDALGQDYIRTARSKGLPARDVILKHALRNSLIPIITLFSNYLPAMLGGSVLIEYLFNIPGMGRLSYLSILQKDFPTLMAVLFIDAIVVMFSILLTDLLYVLIDPRISFGGQGATK
jgi:peptide/nickel transport system permease protein